MIQKRLDNPEVCADVKAQFKNAQDQLRLGNIKHVQKIIVPLLINELSLEQKENLSIQKSGSSASVKVFYTSIYEFPELKPLRDLEKEKYLYALKYAFKYCRENGFYSDFKRLFGEL